MVVSVLDGLAPAGDTAAARLSGGLFLKFETEPVLFDLEDREIVLFIKSMMALISLRSLRSKTALPCGSRLSV